jgi:hypothetical protein
MNPFERHIKEHLSGPAQIPEWIRAAQKKHQRRVARMARKFGCSKEAAERTIRERYDR